MGAIANEDIVNLGELLERLESRLKKADPLAKVLAKVLIEKRITTGPELLKKLSAEQGDDMPISQSKQQEDFIDIRGKRWIR